jgi:Domain of unknown function (DUF1990)
MHIAFTDQVAQLAHRLPFYRTLPLSYADHTRLPERVTRRHIPLQQPIHDLRTAALDFLFDYAIFPTPILRAIPEWQVAQRAMQVGDIIIQQVALPPTRYAVRVVFAVRVLAIQKSATAVGFRYGTLAGHVEQGWSDFSLQVVNAQLYAQIHTRSQPGHVLSRLVAPIVTLPYQQYCTDRALDQMGESFLAANPACR